MSTGCSPTGFSIPGSVLHTGLAELRAALPGAALARVCAAGRLEGWAGGTEHKDGIIHKQCHRLCDKHMPWSTEKHTSTALCVVLILSLDIHAQNAFHRHVSHYLEHQLRVSWRFRSCRKGKNTTFAIFIGGTSLAILQHHLMQVCWSGKSSTGFKLFNSAKLLTGDISVDEHH